MERFRKSLEILANLAIVAASILFAYLAVDRYLPNGQEASAPKFEASISHLVGSKLDLADLAFEKKPQHLVLVLNKNCKFCTLSTDFYKRVVAHNSLSGQTNVVAVFPHSLDEARRYLENNGLQIDEVLSASLVSINVEATPTVILTDDRGTIKSVWVGMLPADKEKEVLAVL